MKTILQINALTVVALLLASCSAAPKPRSAIELFNGTDVSRWDYVLADPQVGKDKVWSVRDGILVCQGAPIGALVGGPRVKDFRLVVEYRWPGGDSKPGNSGIFSRIEEPLTPLPRAIEVQLQHGNAGDVLGLQGKPIQGGQERFFEVKKHAVAGDISGVRKMSAAEKTPGEWNRVEILAQGGSYTVWVNGKLINQVQGVDATPGRVGVQSEGGVIEFRRVTLTPLD